MKKTILLLIFTSFAITKAQTVTIPDANFKAYLVENTAINTNGDNQIQNSEALAYKGVINCNNKNISNLKGIESFINVTSIICNNNLLTSLDVSKNVKLSSLYCNNNKLKNLYLKNGANAILSNFDATNNTDLACIQVDNPELANNYSGWLKDQIASYNIDCESVVYFPSSNFKTYLLANKDINLNNDNEIQVFEAESYAGTINCASRSINSLIGIEAFKNLKYLYCDRNWIDYLDLTRNPNLVEVDCSYNAMHTLNTSNSTALKKLTSQANQITSIDVSKSPLLNYLYLRGNGLTTLDLSKNHALEFLDCESNRITSINVSNSPVLHYIGARGNELSALNLTNNTALKELNFSENALKTIDLSKNTALQNLICYKNLLTDLDVSKNTALINLNCGFNQITNLDVSNNKVLTALTVPNNKLSNLNIRNSNNAAMLKNSNGNYGMLCFDNPNLKCIQVDNVAKANALTANYDWAKDIPAKYSENCSLSVSENSKKAIISYPNPVKNHLYFSELVSDLTITDNTGKMVLKETKDSSSLEVSDLVKGVYVINAVTKSGEKLTQKIIKE